jgi:hypothetical protein
MAKRKHPKEVDVGNHPIEILTEAAHLDPKSVVVAFIDGKGNPSVFFSEMPFEVVCHLKALLDAAVLGKLLGGIA